MINLFRTALLVFLFCYNLHAYDFIDILDGNINITKSGYFKTDKNISAEQAYKEFENNNYKELPKKAISFGFDSDTYWFMFNISTPSNEQFYMDALNNIGHHQDLFIFENGKLISKQINGFLVPIDERYVKVLPIRFKLETNKSNITYILKVDSSTARYTAFAFGTIDKLNNDAYLQYIILTITISIALGLVVYNMFLYLFLRDSIYIYYCLYIFGLTANNFLFTCLPLITYFTIHSFILYIEIAVLIYIIGLIMFTIKLLHLNLTHQKILLFLFCIHAIACVLIYLYYTNSLTVLFYAVSLQAILGYLIYTAARRYLDGYKPSILYLTATGISMVLVVLYLLFYEGILEFNIVTLNLVNFAAPLDAIMLSIALVYKIKILQEEKQIAERALMLRSRQESIGEIIGNIAHQWRAPIAELASSLTALRMQITFDKIARNEIIDEIEKNEDIIQYLSSTVDAFNNLTKPHSQEGAIDINAVIQNSIKLVSATLEQSNIDVQLSLRSTAKLYGDHNALVQAFVILLRNARDALTDCSQNRVIQISTLLKNKNLTISVQDNGGGIKLEPIDKVFEPFMSTKSNGIGIGLFIVKQIIEKKFNGKIYAKNNADGALFEIVLQISTS